MASYRSVPALMLAVQDVLQRRLTDAGATGGLTGSARLIGSADLKPADMGTLLGVYLHRITIDEHGHNRSFPLRAAAAGEDSRVRSRPELPLNLHFLLIAWAPTPVEELALHAFGMQTLAMRAQLDGSHVRVHDPSWTDAERAHVAAEEMRTEDLFRIWDTLPGKYSLSSAYVVRTARVGLPIPPDDGLVLTRVFHAESHGDPT